MEVLVQCSWSVGNMLAEGRAGTHKMHLNRAVSLKLLLLMRAEHIRVCVSRTSRVRTLELLGENKRKLNQV
jgi:hypothetical protein